MRIDQLMRQPAVTCHDTDSLNDAAQQLWDNDLGILPVTDENGKLCGMITDRDICMAAFIQGRPLRDLSVNATMAKTVYSCRPNDSVESAERIMAERQLRRLPVVDEAHRPIGMLTVNDIARAASGSKNGGKDLALQTYNAISRPREQKSA